MSPDFINITNARLLEPSNTLNKYVYAGNNPLEFVDPDGQDLTLFYDPSGATGHVMVLAYNQATGDSAVEAYGPAGGPSLSGEAIQLAGGNVSGVDSYKLPASAEELRQNYASLTVQTTPEVTQSVITEIRQSYGDMPKVFNAVYGRNCTTSCVDAMKELGLAADRTPSGLWTDLFKKYGNAEKRSWLPILNLGFATTAPHQTGVEYGRPRQGYDAFDLFMVLMKRQDCVAISDSASGTKSKQCD